MSDANRIMLIGRLTRDPEKRTTQNGTTVTSFSLANNHTWNSNGEKKEQVNYFNCVAWAKGGDVIAEYCNKGQRLYVEGRLQQRSYDDKDGNKRQAIEIVVEFFQFLSPPKNGAKEPDMPKGDNPFSDDDIPF